MDYLPLFFVAFWCIFPFVCIYVCTYVYMPFITRFSVGNGFLMSQYAFHSSFVNWYGFKICHTIITSYLSCFTPIFISTSVVCYYFTSWAVIYFLQDNIHIFIRSYKSYLIYQTWVILSFEKRLQRRWYSLLSKFIDINRKKQCLPFLFW